MCFNENQDEELRYRKVLYDAVMGEWYSEAEIIEMEVRIIEKERREGI